MEPIAHGHREARESPFVAMLRSYHEFGVHALFRSGEPVQTGALIRYGQDGPARDSIFAAVASALMNRRLS